VRILTGGTASRCPAAGGSSCASVVAL
jgi:hypothetical protein